MKNAYISAEDALLRRFASDNEIEEMFGRFGA